MGQPLSPKVPHALHACATVGQILRSVGQTSLSPRQPGRRSNTEVLPIWHVSQNISRRCPNAEVDLPRWAATTGAGGRRRSARFCRHRGSALHYIIQRIGPPSSSSSTFVFLYESKTLRCQCSITILSSKEKQQMQCVLAHGCRCILAFGTVTMGKVGLQNVTAFKLDKCIYRQGFHIQRQEVLGIDEQQKIPVSIWTIRRGASVWNSIACGGMGLCVKIMLWPVCSKSCHGLCEKLLNSSPETIKKAVQ